MNRIRGSLDSGNNLGQLLGRPVRCAAVILQAPGVRLRDPASQVALGDGTENFSKTLQERVHRGDQLIETLSKFELISRKPRRRTALAEIARACTLNDTTLGLSEGREEVHRGIH